MDNFEKLTQFKNWYEESSGKKLNLPNFLVDEDFKEKKSAAELRDSLVEYFAGDGAEPVDNTSYKLPFGDNTYQIITILPDLKVQVFCKDGDNEENCFYNNLADYVNGRLLSEPWYQDSEAYGPDIEKLAGTYTTQDSAIEAPVLSDQEIAENMFNKKKEDAIKRYRSLIACDDDFVITRENLEKWAAKRTSAEENFDYDNLIEVLCQEK